MVRSARGAASVPATVAVGAVLAVIVLVAVACGGRDDTSADGRAGETASSEAAAPQNAEDDGIHGEFDVGPDPESVREAQPASAHPELTARTASGEQTIRAEHPEDPVHLSVPAIDVGSDLVRLGLNRDRSMEVPENFDLAGWYIHSRRPGEQGPAVIAGHVSSSAGPGVFYRLHELEPGDEIHVTRDDGQRVTFTVDRLEQYPKDHVPEDKVYGRTEASELRLITCGGEFDRRQRRHLDNIVVFASLS